MAVADWIIRIGVNSSGVTKGVDHAKADIQSLDQVIGKIAGAKSALLGAVAGTAIGGIVLSVFNKADEKLNELIQKAKDIKIGSQETGLDTITFQQVSNVLESKGSSPEKLKSSVEHVADAIQKIRDGEDEGAKLQTALARLGVTMDDIKRKNHGQVWLEIAENMKSAELTTEKLAAMKEIFGKNPAELIPTFREGFNGRIANTGVLDDEQQKKIESIRKIQSSTGAGASLVGKEIWNHLATLLGQVKGGASTVFFDPVNTLLGGSEGRNTSADSMGARLEAANEEKAKKAAKIASEKKKREEIDKKRKEILKQITEEQKKASEEEVKSAQPGQRRRILLARDKTIDQQVATIDSDILYNGDDTGEKALKRQQLLNQRSENRRGIRDIDHAAKGVSLLPQSSDARARIGLFSGRQDSSARIMQQQLSTMQNVRTEVQSVRREIQALRLDFDE